LEWRAFERNDELNALDLFAGETLAGGDEQIYRGRGRA